MSQDNTDRTRISTSDRPDSSTSPNRAPKGGRWRPHTDWGLPDWSAPESYAQCKNWDDSQWRWEFLRRRPDYRSDFEAALAAQTNPLELPPDLTNDDANWQLRDGLRAWPFFHKGAQRYALMKFFDPVISEWVYGGPEWNSGLILGGFDGQEWTVTNDGWFAAVEAEHMMALTFDLRRPLKEQITEANATLEQAQFEFLAYGSGAPEGVSIQDAEYLALRLVPAPKLHREKWSLYLRVLDAREAGASLNEIAEILPKSQSRRDAKAAHNVVGQARALQFRF